MQADLFDSINRSRKMRRAPGPLSEDLVEAQIEMAKRFGMRIAGFGWDYWKNTEDTLAPPDVATDPLLLQKALDIEQHLRSRGMRDGNVVP